MLTAMPLAALAAANFDHTVGECCLFHRLEAARWSPARAVPGFDPVTGRDLLNYPPHRHVDYHHMRIEIDIPDMNTPRLNAVQTLTVSTISGPLESLRLNAKLLDIQDVAVAGHRTSFEHDGSALIIRFEPPLPGGMRSEIVTTYTVNDPPFGLLWTLPSPHWPGRAAQIHTQGQPEDNRYWFPMHDFPNVRLSTELIVTVPAGYQVLSNGRLVQGPPPATPPPRRQSAPALQLSNSGAELERSTYHWLQDKPHVSYLVSLVVGQFDIVDVAHAGRHRQPALPMPVYVPKGRAADVPRTYGRTPMMVDLFARLIDEPYPWDKYAHAVVWNFAPGGMENTSATTMYDTAILSEQGLADGDIEGLISHELAHQWFGDLITCNSWEHIWLNEGFATYFTNLWFEHREGQPPNPPARGHDAYQDGVIGNFDRVISVDRAVSPFQPAMASKAYDDPWEVFRRAANPYPKGAAVLHMLRQRLGDEVFFRALAVYVDRFKNRTPETNDLRRAIEEVSGESLEQFFRQWVYHPGVPDLEISLDWERSPPLSLPSPPPTKVHGGDGGELVITVRQIQNIDGYNPAFEFTLPIWYSPQGEAGGRGHGETLHVEVAGRETTARFRLDAEPHIVAVDPQMTVLARTSIRQSVRRWQAQLQHGPTLFARVRAARALSNRDAATAGPSLLREALNTSNHPRLRSEAVKALARGGHAESLLEAAAARPQKLDVPDVRLAIAESLSQLASTPSHLDDNLRRSIESALLRFASAPPHHEPSPRTRAAALQGLAKLGHPPHDHPANYTPKHARLIISAADTESQHDRVRQGALQALGDLGASEGLAVAIRYALPGTYNRTRPIAMNAVVKLARHDPASSFRVLTMCLRDRERRAWEAAGEALVQLGNPAALEHFETLLEEKRDERDRARIRRWISQLSTVREIPDPAPGEPSERAVPPPPRPAAP
jgi:aminopeptidase N